MGFQYFLWVFGDDVQERLPQHRFIFRSVNLAAIRSLAGGGGPVDAMTISIADAGDQTFRDLLLAIDRGRQISKWPIGMCAKPDERPMPKDFRIQPCIAIGPRRHPLPGNDAGKRYHK